MEWILLQVRLRHMEDRAISLPSPLEWMDHKTGTGGAKYLPP